MKVGRK
jgi:hypothetical protein